MKKVITKWTCLIILIWSTYVATDNQGEYDALREADCIPVDLLVELPIAQAAYYKLSSTHAYVRRCMGVNNEKKACVSKDQVVKRENWSVIKDTGTGKKESIDVSWLSHEKCGYQRRSNCPIGQSRECHEKSSTHYFDEVNCTCTCIVQIDGEDTCYAKIAVASATVIWLPILTFILGVVTSALFLIFKSRQNKDVGPKKDYTSPNNEYTPPVGFSDVEQPVEPPNRHTVKDQSSRGNIGFV